MPRNHKNFEYFEYEDDNGAFWNVRGEDGGAFSAVDGHTTDFTNPAFGPQSKRRHVRYVVATDPVTFRSVKGIIYTPAAYAAISAGDVVAVTVPGLATTVNYNVSAKIPERQPIPSNARNLADS